MGAGAFFVLGIFAVCGRMKVLWVLRCAKELVWTAERGLFTLMVALLNATWPVDDLCLLSVREPSLRYALLALLAFTDLSPPA